jgi:arsenate reductase (glutaredoxin)
MLYPIYCAVGPDTWHVGQPTLHVKGDREMALTFYWYPKCGTCRKAKKWLADRGISVREVHIVENPPSREELAQLYQKSGLPLKKFFNTSGMKYRELGMKDKVNTASEKELLDILASDGMLMKRPILTDGEKVVVGFKEEEYQKFFE